MSSGVNECWRRVQRSLTDQLGPKLPSHILEQAELSWCLASIQRERVGAALSRFGCTFWWPRSRVWRVDRAVTAGESKRWCKSRRSPCCRGPDPRCSRCLLWRKSFRPGSRHCTDTSRIVLNLPANCYRGFTFLISAAIFTSRVPNSFNFPTLVSVSKLQCSANANIFCWRCYHSKVSAHFRALLWRGKLLSLCSAWNQIAAARWKKQSLVMDWLPSLKQCLGLSCIFFFYTDLCLWKHELITLTSISTNTRFTITPTCSTCPSRLLWRGREGGEKKIRITFPLEGERES